MRDKTRVERFYMKEHIPQSIKMLTLARSVRWFGWGLCETLIPVVLFSFSRTYAEAGFFRSVYDIVFLLSLPVVGAIADRIPAKKILLFALAVYPLIGISYFAAGAMGAAVFVVLARAINGIAWCCDSVGADTYLRRFAYDDHLSKSFGYLSALPNFLWMVAALGSLLLIPIVPIHWLFLAIVPTSIAAYFILKRAPSDKPAFGEGEKKTFRFVEACKNLRQYGPKIWALAGLTFFISCLDLFGTFFFPLSMLSETNDLAKVVIVTVLFALPSAFAFWLGVYIDKVSKERFLVSVFILIALLLGVLSLIDGFLFQAIGIFILGALEVCAGLALQALVTKASTRDHYGRVSGIMAGADELGAISGPIAIGLLIDATSMHTAYGSLGALSLGVAISLFIALIIKKSATQVAEL